MAHTAELLAQLLVVASSGTTVIVARLPASRRYNVLLQCLGDADYRQMGCTKVTSRLLQSCTSVSIAFSILCTILMLRECQQRQQRTCRKHSRARWWLCRRPMGTLHNYVIQDTLGVRSRACDMQLHRIQSKKLWKQFAFHYSNMQERWSHNPELDLVNGGLPMLWHGTSATEPQHVYATEQGVDFCLSKMLACLTAPLHTLHACSEGCNARCNLANTVVLMFAHPFCKWVFPAGFTFNFARKEGIWGSGTYYSTNPPLAMKYQHRLHSDDSAFSSYLADVKDRSGECSKCAHSTTRCA